MNFPFVDGVTCRNIVKNTFRARKTFFKTPYAKKNLKITEIDNRAAEFTHGSVKNRVEMKIMRSNEGNGAIARWKELVVSYSEQGAKDAVKLSFNADDLRILFPSPLVIPLRL